MVQFIDLKLAVLGNVDVGKSTLLGVLTQGQLDNGRGRARLNLFRYTPHLQHLACLNLTGVRAMCQYFVAI